MASHKMNQSGKSVANKKATNDKTGATDTNTKDLGKEWPRKLKNDGGQWEKLSGSREGNLSEHMSIEDISNSIGDDGTTVQALFNNYASGTNYVSLGEFREIAEAYGCNCQDERTLIDLMASNPNFMFVEGNDGQGRYWIPQIVENSPPPFVKKDGVDDDGNKSEGTDDGNKKTKGASNGGKKTEKKPSKKPWEESRRRLGRTIDEAGGFEEEEPEEHHGRYRDPGYSDAGNMDDMAYSMLQDPGLDDDAGLDDAGPVDAGPWDDAGADFADHDDSPMRSGDLGPDNFDTAQSGASGACPECNGAMDELGCPECGYAADDFEGREMRPDELAGGFDTADYYSGDPQSEPDAYDNLEELSGRRESAARVPHYNEMDENRRRSRNPLLEHDGTAMDGPDGTGLEPHPGKSGGKNSGLPKTKTDTSEMGKEWPRKQKNTGGQAAFGNSKHGEASDGVQDNHGDIGLGKKLKNSGGQWEKLEGGQHGGQMSGGAKKMYEGVSFLNNHVRRHLMEAVNGSHIATANGKYAMTFSVSAGDLVKPKVHTNIAEALLDAEELIQVAGHDNVSFEARFHNGVGQCVLRELIPMPNLPGRGPVVSEGKLLFRFPEIAMDYADAIVNEGKVCRAFEHNWGAAVHAKVTYEDAARMFSALHESV